MKTTVHYLSAMLLVACLTQPVAAQFEGTITYQSSEYQKGSNEHDTEQFTMAITPNRMMLQGEDSYEFMGSIDTEGLLVRLDKKDFVILTGDEQALKISKADITSMMNMFDGQDEASDVAEEADDLNIKRTGETKSIHGYNCEKFILRDNDNENAHTEIWMTKDINVEWGMLAEPWTGSADEIVSSFPTDLVFNKKYFPVLVENYENEKLESKLEAIHIDEKSLNSGVVSVPTGISTMSFQEYLFNKMNKQ